MKKILSTLTASLLILNMQAQLEPNAGNWKTWFISSAKDYRLGAPSSNKNEIAGIIEQQKNLSGDEIQKILYWNSGSPGLRWQNMMNSAWSSDTGRFGALANMLLGAATYDATIVAWDTKYTYQTARPWQVDKRIQCLITGPKSPSYPCEYAVAAGVAVEVFSKFYPSMADSVQRMANELMSSRVKSGAAFPTDVKAGFELGKKIAAIEIEQTKSYVCQLQWDGKAPAGPQNWRGKFAMLPMAGRNRTVVLDSASEFRPAPPPDYSKDMAEIRNFKQNFRSLSNAFYWASHSWFMEQLPEAIFEHNLQFNAPRAARINAIIDIASYDGFVSCWDAKYTYWGIRPSQLDTSFKPAIFITPPFPGYPSGHAMISSIMAELFGYFFPEGKELYRQKAKECAESRFQAGIHFRTDNEVALELGRKVAAAILERVKNDGADDKKGF